MSQLRQAENDHLHALVLKSYSQLVVIGLTAGKYILQQGNFRGQHAIEVAARTRGATEQKVTCKFFATSSDFHHEAQLNEMLPSNAAILGTPVLTSLHRKMSTQSA